MGCCGRGGFRNPNGKTILTRSNSANVRERKIISSAEMHHKIIFDKEVKALDGARGNGRGATILRAKRTKI